MKAITLTQGKIALVDDEDFEFLNQWKWCAHKSKNTFYAEGRLNTNGHIKMHRLIMTPIDSSILIDHKDHNGLNNQRSNLRLATRSQNRVNTIFYIKGSSKFHGVSWDKLSNKWRANIREDKKMKNLGVFKNEEDAALAYNKKAIELHGEFANLNKIAS